MRRRFFDERSTLLCAALLSAFLVAACGHAAEQVALERFFAASRLRDKTALQKIATVAFEPKDQGIVTRFTITRVTPEERQGDIVSKSVTMSAPVELPDGGSAEKTMIVTMQRTSGGPWMITGIILSGAAPSLPPR